MLLLPIAALAVMAFLAILLMVCVAGACERRERLRRSPEPIFSGLIPGALNHDARLLWETQLPALQYLEANPRRGVSANALRPWYAAMARRHPALYEGHSFEEWLEFLNYARVIYHAEERLLLAPFGHNLLDHCRDRCGYDSG